MEPNDILEKLTEEEESEDVNIEEDTRKDIGKLMDDMRELRTEKANLAENSLDMSNEVRELEEARRELEVIKNAAD